MAPKDQVAGLQNESAAGPDTLAHPPRISSHASPIIVQIKGGDPHVSIPNAHFLLGADYVRHGSDLILIGENGREIVLKGYFDADTPPDLVAADNGATIDAHLASRLAGPLAPGQYAQAGGGNALGSPIGKVDAASGEVRVTHADGTKSALQKGDVIYQGDQLNTSVGSSAGFTLADGSALSIGETSRLVMDEMVYDPSGNGGDAKVDLVKGAVTFVSGQISKTNPGAFNFKTPVTDIGIRGTAGGINVGGDGGTTAALLPEKGGTGELSVGGTVLNQPGVASSVSSAGGPPSAPAAMSGQQFGQMFGSALAALPGAAQHIEAQALQQATQAFQQQQQQQQQQMQQLQQQQQQTAAKVAALVDAASGPAGPSAQQLQQQMAMAVGKIQMQIQGDQMRAQMDAQMAGQQAAFHAFQQFQQFINNQGAGDATALAAITGLVNSAELLAGVTVSGNSITVNSTGNDEYASLNTLVTAYTAGSYSTLNSAALTPIETYASSIALMFNQATQLAQGHPSVQGEIQIMNLINTQAQSYLTEAQAIVSAASNRANAAANWLSGLVIGNQVTAYNSYLTADANLISAESAQAQAATNAANHLSDLLQPMIDQAAAAAEDASYLTSMESALGKFLTSASLTVSSSPSYPELITAVNSFIVNGTLTPQSTWEQVVQALAVNGDGTIGTHSITITPLESAWLDGFTAAYNTWSAAEVALTQANASLASAQQLYSGYVAASLAAQNALTAAQLADAQAVAAAAAANTTERVSQQIVEQLAQKTMSTAGSTAQTALADAASLIGTADSTRAQLIVDAISHALSPASVTTTTLNAESAAIQSAVTSLASDDSSASTALSQASYALYTLSSLPQNIGSALSDVSLAASAQLTQASLDYARISAFSSQVHQDYVSAVADLSAANSALSASSAALLSLAQSAALDYYNAASNSLLSLGTISGTVRNKLDTEISTANSFLTADQGSLTTASGIYSSLSASLLGTVSLSGLSLSISLVDSSIISVPTTLTIGALNTALGSASTSIGNAITTLGLYSSTETAALSGATAATASALAYSNAATTETDPALAAVDAQHAAAQAGIVAADVQSLSSLRTSVSLISSTYDIATKAALWTSAALDYQNAFVSANGAFLGNGAVGTTGILGTSGTMNLITGQAANASTAAHAIDVLYGTWSGNPNISNLDSTSYGQLQSAESNAQQLLAHLNSVLGSAQSAAGSVSTYLTNAKVDYAATALLAQTGSALAAAQAEHEAASAAIAVANYVAPFSDTTIVNSNGNTITIQGYESLILSDLNAIASAQASAQSAAQNLAIVSAVQHYTAIAASAALQAQSANTDATAAANLVQQDAQLVFNNLSSPSLSTYVSNLVTAENRVIADYNLANTAALSAASAMTSAGTYAPLSGGDTAETSLLTVGTANLTAAQAAAASALATKNAVSTVFTNASLAAASALSASVNNAAASQVISSIQNVVAGNYSQALTLQTDAQSQATNAGSYYASASASLTSLIGSITANFSAADYTNSTLTIGSLYAKAHALAQSINTSSTSLFSESSALTSEIASLLADSVTLSGLSKTTAGLAAAQSAGIDANIQFQGSGSVVGIVANDQLMQLNATALKSAVANASSLANAFAQFQTNASTQSKLTAITAVQAAEAAMTAGFTMTPSLAVSVSEAAPAATPTTASITPTYGTATITDGSGTVFGQTITPTGVSAAHGVVSLSNGTLNYTPTAYYHGQETLTLSALDTATITIAGLTETFSTKATGTIQFTVAETEFQSTLSAISVSAPVQGTTTLGTTALAAAYSSPDGTAIGAVKITSLPTYGTLTLNNAAVTLNGIYSQADYGSMVYTASSTYLGADSFTIASLDSFGYANAGTAFSTAQTVSVTMTMPSVSVVSHSFNLSSVASAAIERVIGTGSDVFNTGAADSGTIFLSESGQTGTLSVGSMAQGGFLGAYQSGNNAVFQLTSAGGGGQLIVENQFSTTTPMGISTLLDNSSNGNGTMHIVGSTAATNGTLTGTSSSDLILGNLGESVLISGGGQDDFFVGGGNQTIYGTDGYSTSSDANFIGGTANYVMSGATSIAYSAQGPVTVYTNSLALVLNSPRIASFANGSYDVIFYDANVMTFYEQLFTSSGVATGSLQALPSLSLSAAPTGVKLVDTSTGFALVYDQGTGIGIYQQNITTGSIYTSTITSAVSTSVSELALSSLGTAGIGITWSDGTSAFNQTVGLTQNANLAASPHTVATGNAADVQVISLINGTQVTAWDDTGVDHLELITSAGVATTVPLSASVSDVRLVSFGSSFALASINTNNATANIQTTFYDATGNVISGHSNQIQTSDATITNYQMLALANGGFVVEWLGTTGIHAAFYTPNGYTTNSGEPLLITSNYLSGKLGTMQALADGGVLFGWIGSDNNVYTQRFDAAGDPVGIVTLTTASTTYTDTLYAIDQIAGTAGNDVFTAGTVGTSPTFRASAGNDIYNGGQVSYENLWTGVTVNLGASSATKGTLGADTLNGVTSVTGSGFADTITAGGVTGQTYFIAGGGGADTLNGSAAGTYVNFTVGSQDHAVINGGLSTNTVQFQSYSGATQSSTFTLGSLAGDTITGVDTISLYGGQVTTLVTDINSALYTTTMNGGRSPYALDLAVQGTSADSVILNGAWVKGSTTNGYTDYQGFITDPTYLSLYGPGYMTMSISSEINVTVNAPSENVVNHSFNLSTPLYPVEKVIGTGGDTFTTGATVSANLYIAEAGHTGTLNLSSLTPYGISSIYQSGNDAVIQMSEAGGGGQITIQNQFYTGTGTQQGISTIIDGSLGTLHLDGTNVLANGTITGTSGNDLILGNLPSETVLTGGTGGQDIFYAGNGSNQTIIGGNAFVTAGGVSTFQTAMVDYSGSGATGIQYVGWTMSNPSVSLTDTMSPPVMFGLGAGGYESVWFDATLGKILGQQYDSADRQIGGIATLATVGTSAQVSALVGTAITGGFEIAFESAGANGTIGLTAVSDVNLVNGVGTIASATLAGSVALAGGLAIAQTTGATASIAWSNGTTLSQESVSGATLSGLTTVSGTALTDVQMTALTGGTPVTTWADSAGYHLKIGTGAAQLVNTLDGGQNLSNVRVSAISAAGGGGFVLTGTADNGNYIITDRFNAAGTMTASSSNTLYGGTAAVTNLNVAGLAGGGYVVEWSNADTSQSAAVFDPSNHMIWQPFGVQTTSVVTALGPIAALSDGSFILPEPYNFNNTALTNFQHFGANGNLDAGVFLTYGTVTAVDTLNNISQISGTSGSDTFQIGMPGNMAFLASGGSDTYSNQGLGNSLVSYQNMSGAVTISLGSNGYAYKPNGVDQLYNVNTVLGSSYADTLSAEYLSTGQSVTLMGGGGADTLYGSYANGTYVTFVIGSQDFATVHGYYSSNTLEFQNFSNTTQSNSFSLVGQGGTHLTGIDTINLTGGQVTTLSTDINSAIATNIRTGTIASLTVEGTVADTLTLTGNWAVGNNGPTGYTEYVGTGTGNYWGDQITLDVANTVHTSIYVPTAALSLGTTTQFYAIADSSNFVIPVTELGTGGAAITMTGLGNYSYNEGGYSFNYGSGTLTLPVSDSGTLLLDLPNPGIYQATFSAGSTPVVATLTNIPPMSETIYSQPQPRATTSGSSVGLGLSLSDPFGAKLPNETYTVTASAAHGTLQTVSTPWNTSAWGGTPSVATNGSSVVLSYNEQYQGYSGNWNFTTTATQTGTMVLNWAYSGFHAWFQAQAGISLIENGVVDGGPLQTGGVSGGFSWSGSTTISVTQGEVYGFSLSGSNYDSTDVLQGTLTVSSPTTAMTTSGSNLTFTGNAAAIAGDLAGLTYTSNPGYAGTDVVHTTIQDTTLATNTLTPTLSTDVGVLVSPLEQGGGGYLTSGSIAYLSENAAVNTTLTRGGTAGYDGSGTLVYYAANDGFVGKDSIPTTYNGSTTETVRVVSGITVANQGVPTLGTLAFTGTQVATLNGGFNVGTGNFTVAGWLNPTTIAGTQVINAKNISTADPVGFVTELVNGKPTFILTDPLLSGSHTLTIASTVPLAANAWSSVAVTRTGSVYHLYVNGTEVGNADAGFASNIQTTNPFTVGAQLDTTTNTTVTTATGFHGMMADGSLWKTALPASTLMQWQHNDITVGASGLYADWSGLTDNIRSGVTQVPDASGNGHGLNLGFGTVGAAPSVQLIPAAAFHFNTNNSVNATISAAGTLNNVTLSGWVQLTQGVTGDYILRLGDDGGAGNGLLISVNSAGKVVASTYNENDTVNHGLAITSNATVTDGLWHYVSATETAAGAITLYIDGQAITTTGTSPTGTSNGGTATSLAIDATAPLIIGNGYAANVADVSVWNGARSQTAIQTDMNTLLSGGETGLVSLYRLDGLPTTSYTALGSETQVGLSTGYYQDAPSTTALADGGAVVTWYAANPDGTLNIVGQRLDAAGNQVGGEFVVTDTYGVTLLGQSVTGLTNGDFVVTWVPGTTIASVVMAQLYDPTGTVIGDPFQVNSNWGDGIRSMATAALADGGFVTTWTALNANGVNSWSIYAQVVSAAGVPQGQFQVSPSGFDSNQAQIQPQVIGLTDGGFVVSWLAENGDGSGNAVFAEKFSSTGTLLAGPFQVNTYTSDDQYDAHIASLPNGGFVITWDSVGQDGSGFGVYGQRYDASATAVGSEFRINTTTVGNQSANTVTSLAGGGFMVTWQGPQPSGALGVYGQIYNAAGVAMGGEFLVSGTAGNSTSPAVTGLSNGEILTAWVSANGGAATNIYGQLYAPPPGGLIDSAVNATDVGTVSGQASIAYTAAPVFSATTYTLENQSLTGTISASSSNGDPLAYSVHGLPGSGTLTLTGNTYTYTPMAGMVGNDVFSIDVTDLTTNTTTTDVIALGVVNPIVNMGISRPASAMPPPSDGYLHFGGSGEISLATPANVMTGTGAFTYGMWVRANSSASPQQLFFVGSNAGVPGTAVGLSIDPWGHLAVMDYYHGWGTTAPVITDNNWHYVALTYSGATNGGDFGVSVDGATAAFANIDYSPGNFVTSDTNLNINGSIALIGGIPGNSQNFLGDMAQFGEWNASLSLSQIQAAMSATAAANTVDTIGLQAYYAMTSNGAGTLTDGSGHGGDTSLTGSGASFGSVPPTPNFVHLNGTAPITVAGNAAFATGAGAFTYGAWVRTTTNSSMQNVLFVGDYTNPGSGYRLSVNTSGYLEESLAGLNILSESSVVVGDGNWHYVASTYDGSGNSALYVDGVLTGTVGGYTAAITANTYGLSIGGGQGAYSGWNFQFTGDIAQVGGWNTALTQAQIQANMASQSPATSVGLLAYYPVGAAVGPTLYDASGNGHMAALGSGAVIETVSSAATPSTSLTVQEHASVSGQLTATDYAGGTTTWSLAAGASTLTTALGALVTVNSDGTFTYNAAGSAGTGYASGSDQFTVVLTDSTGVVNSQVIDVTVQNAIALTGVTTGGNVITGHTISASSGIAATGTLNLADSLGTVTAGLLGAAAGATETIATQHGSVTLNTTTLAYTYTPTAGYVGQDSFTLALSDAHGATDPTVYVNVHQTPTISGLTNLSVSSYTPQTLNLGLSGISGNGSYTATVSVGGGMLFLSHTGNWYSASDFDVVDTQTGQGSTLTLSGGYTAISQALKSIIYMPTWDSPASGSTLSVTLQSNEQTLTSSSATITSTLAVPYASYTGSNATAVTGFVSTQLDNITVEAHVKWDGSQQSADGQFIFYNGNSGLTGFGLRVFNDGSVGFMAGGDGAGQTQAGVLVANQWTDLALVRNNGMFSLYANGQYYALTDPYQTVSSLNGTDNNSGTVVAGQTVIGNTAATGSSLGFHGQIADVMYWNSARSQFAYYDPRQSSNPDPTLAANMTLSTVAGSPSLSVMLPQQTVGTLGDAVRTISLESSLGLTFTPLTNAATANGHVSLTSGGTLTYTPNAGFFGADSVVISAAVAGGGTAQETISLISAQAAHTIIGETSSLWSTSLTSAGSNDAVSLSDYAYLTYDLGISSSILNVSAANFSTLDVLNGALTIRTSSQIDSTSRLSVESGGILSVAAGATMTDNGSFVISGGTVAGAGTVVIAGSFSDMPSEGYNAFTVNGNLVFAAQASQITLNSNILGSGTVTNQSSMQVNGYQEVAPVLVNNGSLNIMDYAKLTLDRSFTNSEWLGLNHLSNLTTNGTFTNTGQINSSNGGNTIAAMVIDNQGTISSVWGAGLNFNPALSMTNEGIINLVGGGISVAPIDQTTFDQFTNTGLIVGGHAFASAASITDMNLYNTLLTSNGTIEVGDSSNYGMAPVSISDASASWMTVVGTVDLGGSSDVILHTYGATADELYINGRITLGGTLDIRSQIAPTDFGTAHEVIGSVTGMVGSFQTITGLYDPSNPTYVYDPLFNTNGLSLTAEHLTQSFGFGTSTLTGQYLIGGHAGNTLIGTGSGDVLIGQEGNDKILVGDSSFHFIDGGGGFNILAFSPDTNSSTTLDLSAVPAGLVEHIQEIDLSRITNATLTLDAAHVQAMTQNAANAVVGGTTPSLIVFGGAGEQVNFTDNGWTGGTTAQSATTPDGHTDSYTVYTNAQAHVQVLVQHSMSASHV